jgi:hypothetical protein
MRATDAAQACAGIRAGAIPITATRAAKGSPGVGNGRKPGGTMVGRGFIAGTESLWVGGTALQRPRSAG